MHSSQRLDKSRKKSAVQAAFAKAAPMLRCAGEVDSGTSRSMDRFGRRLIDQEQFDLSGKTGVESNHRIIRNRVSSVPAWSDDELRSRRSQRTLHKAWSLATAGQWTANNPAAGQCNVTALLIHELFGGDLLKTPQPAGDHFYNRIEGRRYDFTTSQFDQPIAYMDLPASRTDAELGATSDQLTELRVAFRKHHTKSG